MDPFHLELPTQFTSERLLLRTYHPGDSAMYYQMLRANWDHLYEYLPAELMAVRNEGDVQAEFRRQQAEWDLRNLFIFGAWEQATGVHVGETYLANADWNVPLIEVGYFIVQSKTGKGYAGEAAQATTRYAFEHMKVNRVDIRIAAYNQASMRVAERSGFVQEGRLRQHHRKKDGALVDTLWYGLLRSEWQRKNR